MKLFIALILAIALAGASEETMMILKPQVHGSLPFAANDPFTSKERCVLKAVSRFKTNYLRFVVTKRAKRIAELYRLERLRRKKFKLRNTWGNSRDLKETVKASREEEYNQQHIRQFIKKMGKKMQIFGRVYSEIELQDPQKLLKTIRHNWINALTVDTSNNRESVLASEIQNLLIHQFSLSKRYKADLEHCHLSTAPSLRRCEKMFGKNSCEVLYSGVVHKKCPKGLFRVGCCSCAPSCPQDHFLEDHYFCRPKQSYQLDQFLTKEECEKQLGRCDLIADHFVGQCKPGFKKAADLPECQVECPRGWTEMQEKCLKPGIVSLGTPFVWIKSDD